MKKWKTTPPAHLDGWKSKKWGERTKIKEFRTESGLLQGKSEDFREEQPETSNNTRKIREKSGRLITAVETLIKGSEEEGMLDRTTEMQEGE